MTVIDKYFPYESYRPQQSEMLDAVYKAVGQHKSIMINAPTGSGKTSVIAPAIAYAKAHDMKVIVAVRTKTQLSIFINELDKIRRKNPDLTFAYMIGKGAMCPKFDPRDINVYKYCELCKWQSTVALLKHGNMQNEYCEYYLRTFAASNTNSIIPSQECIIKAKYMLHNTMHYEDLRKYIGKELCPYETCCVAAGNTDIIIMNYAHIINPDIRAALFHNLNIVEQNTIVIFDEAHNLGNAVMDALTCSITEKILMDAKKEIDYVNGNNSDLMDLFKHLMYILDANSTIQEDTIIDINDLLNHDINISHLQEITIGICEDLRKSMLQGFEYKDGAMDKIKEFVGLLKNASISNVNYIAVLKPSSYGVILSIQNIDPSEYLIDLSKTFHSIIMTSGTLSPIDMYKKYYFAKSTNIETLSLKNWFPKENRKIYCLGDITSTYKMRNDTQNVFLTRTYIDNFASIPGNVAIFFPSYSTMNQYRLGISTSKEIFAEPQNAIEASKLLKKFMELPSQNKSGLLLAVCGGKWSEGIDYMGDMLSGAMVIGFPLSLYNSIQVSINTSFKNKYGDDGEFIAYNLPALNRTLQALGRVLRSPEDKGILVLGDTRYSWSMLRNKLPEWIRTEMVSVRGGKFPSI